MICNVSQTKTYSRIHSESKIFTSREVSFPTLWQLLASISLEVPFWKYLVSQGVLFRKEMFH